MRIKGRPQVDNVGWERATGGIVRVMAAVDRHSAGLAQRSCIGFRRLAAKLDRAADLSRD